MEAMDARRLELYEQLKPTLGELPARNLVLMLPAEPERLARTDDIERLRGDLTAEMNTRFAELRGEMHTGFARVDAGFARVDAGFARIDAKFAQMETTLTKRVITILGSWTILVVSAYAWGLAFLRP